MHRTQISNQGSLKTRQAIFRSVRVTIIVDKQEALSIMSVCLYSLP